MSTVILVLAIVVVLLALLSVVRLLLAGPSRTSQIVGQISEYGYAEPAAATAGAGDGLEPPRAKNLAGAAAALGDALARRQGADRERDIRARLVSAGLYTRTPRAFFVAQALTAGILFLLWLVLGRSAGTLVFIFGLPATLALGWVLPSFLLSRRIAQRYNEIDKELPSLIDLLVVTVEAGVGFAGSMRLAAEQIEGPLGDELRLTIQEQNVGATTDEALKHMARRADTPGVRAFVRAIVQGELLGVSIAQILRNLANDMRKKRKARAEEQAQKAPVKMLFPLVLLIFPAMFIVLLLPALIAIKDTLSTG